MTTKYHNTYYNTLLYHTIHTILYTTYYTIHTIHTIHTTLFNTIHTIHTILYTHTTPSFYSRTLWKPLFRPHYTQQRHHNLLYRPHRRMHHWHIHTLLLYSFQPITISHHQFQPIRSSHLHLHLPFHPLHQMAARCAPFYHVSSELILNTGNGIGHECPRHQMWWKGGKVRGKVSYK